MARAKEALNAAAAAAGGERGPFSGTAATAALQAATCDPHVAANLIKVPLITLSVQRIVSPLPRFLPRLACAMIVCKRSRPAISLFSAASTAAFVADLVPRAACSSS